MRACMRACVYVVLLDKTGHNYIDHMYLMYSNNNNNNAFIFPT